LKLLPLLAAVVVDTRGNFTVSVVNTGGKYSDDDLPTVATTPGVPAVACLPAVAEDSALFSIMLLLAILLLMGSCCY
jgi:hypothetical protein